MDLRFIGLPCEGTITGPFAATSPPWTPANPHRGLDIANVVGTPIIWQSPNEGKIVEFFDPNDDFGNGVCVDVIGTPWYVLFAHMSSMFVKLGDFVELGTKLGEIGATGKVTGPHVHVQVCKNTYFPVDISYSADYQGFIMADVMPRAEVVKIIQEFMSQDEVSKSEVVLSLVAQILGAETNTYTNVERVQTVRDALWAQWKEKYLELFS